MSVFTHFHDETIAVFAPVAFHQKSIRSMAQRKQRKHRGHVTTRCKCLIFVAFKDLSTQHFYDFFGIEIINAPGKSRTFHCNSKTKSLETWFGCSMPYVGMYRLLDIGSQQIFHHKIFPKWQPPCFSESGPHCVFQNVVSGKLVFVFFPPRVVSNWQSRRCYCQTDSKTYCHLLSQN